MTTEKETDLETKKIFCCGCANHVEARLTSGKEVYAHREDLHSLPFWKCDTCKNFVGCHHKTKTPTKPLGCIPTAEIKNARRHIHKILDPLWEGSKTKRTLLYDLIADKTGRSYYHTAYIRTIEEARNVYKIILEIKNSDIWKKINN